MRAFWGARRLGAVFGGVLLIHFVACGDDTAPGGPAQPACAEAAECDDDEPCTIDACVDGVCINNPQTDGDAPEQVAGDCQRVVCTGGVAQTVGDEGDPLDDLEVCTLDLCVGGQVEHTPLIDQHPCTVGFGSGSCDQGRCQVPCTSTTAATVCEDLNPCTTDRCGSDDFCEHDAVPDGAVDESLQVAGDCHELRCTGGVVSEDIDQDDVPDDSEACTADVCSEDGVPSSTEFSCTLPEWCGGGGDPTACGCLSDGTMGPQSAGTAISDGSVGNRSWDTVTGVLDPGDQQLAQVSSMVSGDTSTYLRVSGFNFDIPDHATIVGIEVEWLRTALSGVGLVDNAVRIVKGGVVASADRSRSDIWLAEANPTYVSYGGPTDLWGETWTPAEVNASSFGAALSVRYGGSSGNDWPQVDHARITVHFEVDCQ